MKIALIGATGRSGREILRLGLEQGHEFRLLARDPSKLSESRSFTVVAGDVRDEAAVRNLIGSECDAVISALGIVEPREPTNVFSDGMRVIITVMQRSGVARLLAISASGFHIDRYDNPMTLPAKLILKQVFRNSYADLARMETVIQESDRAWSLFVPPQLTDGPATGKVRTSIGHNVPFGFRISRRDLALVMLERIGDQASYGQSLYVG